MAVTSSEAGSVAHYSSDRYGSTPTPHGVFCSCRSGQVLAPPSTMIRACPRPMSPNEPPSRDEADQEGCCKPMSRVQEHLAQANGQIAELKVQIVRQRAIVKYALDTGQRSEMTESLLDALEGSLRLFEKHRVLILGELQRQPSE